MTLNKAYRHYVPASGWMQARSYSVAYEDAMPDFVSHWMSDLFEVNLIWAAMINYIFGKHESLNILHAAEYFFRS